MASGPPAHTLSEALEGSIVGGALRIVFRGHVGKPGAKGLAGDRVGFDHRTPGRNRARFSFKE